MLLFFCEKNQNLLDIQEHYICKLGKIRSELKLLSGVYYWFLKLYTRIVWHSYSPLHVILLRKGSSRSGAMCVKPSPLVILSSVHEPHSHATYKWTLTSIFCAVCSRKVTEKHARCFWSSGQNSLTTSSAPCVMSPFLRRMWVVIVCLHGFAFEYFFTLSYQICQVLR